jgi:ribosomal-protein-alanine N-acetyltransferase
MIETERLRLVPWPPEALDLVQLGAALAVRVPRDWRPDVIDVLPAHDPDFGPQAILDHEQRELLGSAGFTGGPDADGTIELGYEVAPDHRRLGYATEAAAALTRWAFTQPGVLRVIAATDADNPASIRVLERIGFVPAGHRGAQLLWELRP